MTIDTSVLRWHRADTRGLANADGSDLPQGARLQLLTPNGRTVIRPWQSKSAKPNRLYSNVKGRVCHRGLLYFRAILTVQRHRTWTNQKYRVRC